MNQPPRLKCILRLQIYTECIYFIIFISSISFHQCHFMNFISIDLSNTHQANTAYFHTLLIPFYQFHFINFILSLLFYQFYFINFSLFHCIAFHFINFVSLHSISFYLINFISFYLWISFHFIHEFHFILSISFHCILLHFISFYLSISLQ